jgi:hypothetical protein
MTHIADDDRSMLALYQPPLMRDKWQNASEIAPTAA